LEVKYSKIPEKARISFLSSSKEAEVLEACLGSHYGFRVKCGMKMDLE